jgi:hypothetical protein
MKVNALLSASLLCGMAAGYEVTFYRGRDCRGAQLSTRPARNNICDYILPVDNQAASVIVQRESGDTPNGSE